MARSSPIKGTLILLVRHGQTPTTGKHLPGRAPGLHLSDTGRAQAQGVAERIAALPTIDAVYASPLERTRETARPIGAARGVKVQIDKGLTEIDVGDWTGDALSVARKRPEWKTLQTWPSGFRFPGGESLAEMQSRVGATLDRLIAKHPGGVIVVVSHADVIKAAVMAALGTHLDLFERVAISPCSVSAIAYGPGPTAKAGAPAPMVLSVNCLSDLASLVPS
ncbi:MAG: MSMEG_4193 family putative phosphomutase [Pseudonocardiaceae bacterium]